VIISTSKKNASAKTKISYATIIKIFLLLLDRPDNDLSETEIVFKKLLSNSTKDTLLRLKDNNF
jgi:hypothetical protein